MPLRDHFHPPLFDLRKWEGVHAQWPAMIVIELNRHSPARYAAEPGVHQGALIEEYEVRVYDTSSALRLVAAVEIVSPANKDRPESRRAFVAKSAALLQQRVCVGIVDLVSSRTDNLYCELLEFIGEADVPLPDGPPSLYAVTSRSTKKDTNWLVESWMHPLSIGQPLPTLPLWLADDLAVPVDLESSYEETCRTLRLPKAVLGPGEPA
jgi:Protein of unknown function (DUF4058)